MPKVEVPLFSRVYKNADETVLSDDAARQYNGFIDELGGINVRPGEVLAVNTARRNDGIFVWPDKDFVVTVDEGEVTLRTVSGETLVSAFSGYYVSFATGNPTIFADNGTYVFMAGGGKINYVSTLGVVAAVGDADAPTTVTHIAFLDGRILAIDGTGKFYWSELLTNTDWSALSFATAEGSPDNNRAMYVVQRQILLLGSVSTEIWESDADAVFARIPGGLLETGCIAPYSAIKFKDSLIWLNHERQFVEFTGTGVKYLSSRYDKEILAFSVVSDCIGATVFKDGQRYCLFHFPIQRRTLAYNPAIDDWSEWGNWDATNLTWVPYDLRSAAYDYSSGKTFVGKRDTKAIACLSSNSKVDLITPSTTRSFKFLRQTGHIDHGSLDKKVMESLSFRAKRGTSSTTATPKLMFRYRNDGRALWSNIRHLDLGVIGDVSFIVELRRLGVFKARQYEISATDDIDIVLSKAEADITVLS